ncbi:MAG: YgiT-type zinc finger protein [Oscillospiraceae bacterium]|nr:YgiT-type zinc finger protein [Oscillospiraceae bacterium]
MIIVKDVPADVCTQCGERYFDDDVMENLEKIVNSLKNLSTEISVVNYRGKVA